MDANKLLSAKHLNPDERIIKISADEALSLMADVLIDNNLEVDFNKFSREELEILINDYAQAVITCHPENSHQERAALYKNKSILIKHGLNEDDLESLDFC